MKTEDDYALLARNVRGEHSRLLGGRVGEAPWLRLGGKTTYVPRSQMVIDDSDPNAEIVRANWRRMLMKRRPTVRRIKGTEWRLAGTAHWSHSYQDQVEISKALANMIRRAGAKARVIKWKDQVGVYYQNRKDPIEAVWGGQPSSMRGMPTQYEWKPVVYGSKDTEAWKRTQQRAKYRWWNDNMIDQDQELLNLSNRSITSEILSTDLASPPSPIRSLIEKFGRPELTRYVNEKPTFRLMILREPADMAYNEQYGWQNGIRMGWVNRQQAIDILSQRGIYPLEEELNELFPPDIIAWQSSMDNLQRMAEEREKLNQAFDPFKEGVEYLEGRAASIVAEDMFGTQGRPEVFRDYSWTVLDPDEMLETGIGESVFTLYDVLNEVGDGKLGSQLEGSDYKQAYSELMREAGFSGIEIQDAWYDLTSTEIAQMFNEPEVAREMARRSKRSIERLSEITGAEIDLEDIDNANVERMMEPPMEGFEALEDDLFSPQFTGYSGAAKAGPYEGMTMEERLDTQGEGFIINNPMRTPEPRPIDGDGYLLDEQERLDRLDEEERLEVFLRENPEAAFGVPKRFKKAEDEDDD